MKIISLNHKKADQDIRSEFVRNLEMMGGRDILIKRLKDMIPELDGVVVVSTCNRFEVIYNTSRPTSIFKDAKALCQLVGTDAELHSELFNFYEDGKAIKHLLRVASGIDSMVLGEDEIYRQVKEAYQKSLEAGASSKELNIIFQKSFEAVKAVKTRTGISNVPVSIGTLVSNLVSSKYDPENTKILVLGASGKTGGIVMRDLISKGFENIFGCVRKHGTEDRFWSDYPKEMTAADYSDRYKLLDEMDVVISATSGPHFTLTYKGVKEAIVSDKKRLFIDLAIPSDIEDRVREIGDSSFYAIDDFQRLSEEFNKKKEILAENVADELGVWVDEIEKEVELVRLMSISEVLRTKIEEKGIAKLLISAKQSLTSKEIRDVTDWFLQYTRA